MTAPRGLGTWAASILARAKRASLSVLGLEVAPVPKWYAGVRFASTLEADWAATFDAYGIAWSYEPIAVRLSNGECYRCDFWLPGQRVWAEVKGPHNLRVSKPARLSVDIGSDPWEIASPLVVVLRVPNGPYLSIEDIGGGRSIGLTECGRCENWTFIPYHGSWECRVCGWWVERLGGPDELPFVRAPRHGDRVNLGAYLGAA